MGGSRSTGIDVRFGAGAPAGGVSALPHAGQNRLFALVDWPQRGHDTLEGSRPCGSTRSPLAASRSLASTDSPTSRVTTEETPSPSASGTSSR
ncbi:hypothetical protein COSO111634_38210 [Corallococcus soli]